ncbi:helix-turn-helix domain-containing protein [Parafrankia discariae]|uniref:helix-turn-helix domain-containing protein n=1 Tax=Parafrankia discariae TaxID=365528 RepID=UPI0009789663
MRCGDPDLHTGAETPSHVRTHVRILSVECDLSRFRLYPAPEQAAVLESHCHHARFVWNLAVEQQAWWTPRRGPAPGHQGPGRAGTSDRKQARTGRSRRTGGACR